MNLGWKLAAEVNGFVPSWLLDNFERNHPEVNRSLADRVSGLAVAYPADEARILSPATLRPTCSWTRAAVQNGCVSYYEVGALRCWHDTTHQRLCGSSTTSSSGLPCAPMK
jgi:hypothetical protein